MIRIALFGSNEEKIRKLSAEAGMSATEIANIIISAIDGAEFSQMIVVRFKNDVNPAELKPAAKKKRFRRSSNWNINI